MQLNFRKIGKGSPLIILHGLYGSGDNWYSIAKALSKKYTVYLVDQRNHGNSAHDTEMNYEVLSKDLLSFFEAHKIEKGCVLGHSMGGKVAMKFTLENPDKVERLIVVDIALRDYSPTGDFAEQAAMHQGIIQALSKLDISVETRTEIDKQLSESIEHPSVRQFLLKNLKRSEDGERFVWQINLLALEDNLEALLDNVADNSKPIDSPTLVISGKKSEYIKEADKEEFKKYFTNLQIEEMNTGHWVHAEEPEAFIKLLKEFLNC